LSYIIGVRFEWDAKKAAANLKKHGVPFEEAQTAFDDALAAYYPDSLNERRFILIGYSERRRLLYVVHAEVAFHTIRIISARKATKHEKAHYEDD
jgi:uncharacterized protein